MNTKHQVLILNLIMILKLGNSVSENKSLSSESGGIPEEIIRAKKIKARIVGGTEVQDPSKFGYHAQYGYNCAGAILSQTWVISAAHCGKKDYVRVGSKYLGQGLLISVARHIFHPVWNQEIKPHPHEMDIVLLELERPIAYNYYIYPIKIGKVQHLSVGLMLTVSGWGSTKTAGALSKVLRSVKLPIAKKSLCQRIGHPYYSGKLTDNMFCAGYAQGHKDACQGDSGGPAVANKRLYGLVSFGYECALPNVYGVYAKVGIVIPWIEAVTNLTVT